MLLGGPIPALYLVKGVGEEGDSSNPLHFLTPPAPWGLCVFLSKGDPHSLGVGENGNKTLRMRAADFFIVRVPSIT